MKYLCPNLLKGEPTDDDFPEPAERTSCHAAPSLVGDTFAPAPADSDLNLFSGKICHIDRLTIFEICFTSSLNLFAESPCKRGHKAPFHPAFYHKVIHGL